MRTLLRTGFWICCVLAAGSWSSPLLPSAVVSGATLVTTRTFREDGGRSNSNFPLQFGQVFRRGDVQAATQKFIIQNQNNGVTLPHQVTSIQTHDDGSYFHVVFDVWVDSVAANGTLTLSIYKTAGTYSQAQVRSTADFTAGHDLKIQLSRVMDYNGNPVGSGRFTMALGGSIGSSARVTKFATGGLRDGWEVRGELRDDAGGTPDPHLFAVWLVEALTNPSAPSSAHALKHVAIVGQPWINVPGAQQRFYQMALYDGASLIRNFTTNQTFTSAQVNVSTNTITIAQHGLHKGQPFLVSGSSPMPGGLSPNTIYYAGVVDANTISPHPEPLDGFYRRPSAGDFIDITSPGAGTYTLIPLVNNTYRSGFWTATVDGEENWTANKPSLHSELTASEKTYWLQTGALPLFDTSLSSANLPEMDYIPGTAGHWRPDISGTGDAYMIGYLPSWVARAFLNQTKAGLKACRINALVSAHIYVGFTLNEELVSGVKLARIPTFNNGPNNNGVGYPGLGAVKPTTYWFSTSNKTSDTTTPAGDADGLFYEQTAVDGSHWPQAPAYPYMVEGRQHMLYALRLDANRHMFSSARKTKAIGATTYHGLVVADGQVRSAAWRFRNVMLAGRLGDQADSETRYFRDTTTSNLAYLVAHRASQDAAFQALGWHERGTKEIGCFQIHFNTAVFTWAALLIRSPEARTMRDHYLKFTKGLAEGSLSGSPFYASAYIVNSAPAFDQSGWAGSWDKVYVTEFRVDIATDGTLTRRDSQVTLTNGDAVIWFDPTRPPELSYAAVYRVRDVNNVNKTFKLADTVSGPAKTFAQSYTNLEVGYRLQYAPATSFFGGSQGNDNSYALLVQGSLKWAKTSGVTGLDAGIANMNARITAPGLDPKYRIVDTITVP